MDLTPFKLDIDDLLHKFVEDGSTTLADMKQLWLSRKFSFIYEARPTTNVAFFMQSLYAHSLSYMDPRNSLSLRLGAVYCLYCLYETQPFKPRFKIYLSLEELRRLKDLVIDAKQHAIGVFSALIKRIIDRNILIFGSVDINDGSVNARISEITKRQSMGIQIAYERLFGNAKIELLHEGFDSLLDLQKLKKMSVEYAEAKELITKESRDLGVEHMDWNQKLIGDAVMKVSENWDAQKEDFYQHTGVNVPWNQNPLS